MCVCVCLYVCMCVWSACVLTNKCLIDTTWAWSHKEGGDYIIAHTKNLEKLTDISKILNDIQIESMKVEVGKKQTKCCRNLKLMREHCVLILT